MLLKWLKTVIQIRKSPLNDPKKYRAVAGSLVSNPNELAKSPRVQAHIKQLEEFRLNAWKDKNL